MNTWKEQVLAIFAEMGNTEEVPIEAQPDNRVSFKTGYTDNYDKELSEQQSLVTYGVEIGKFNYLFKFITSVIKEIQETIPVYTDDTGEQKVDIATITENTSAFNVLTHLLCIDDTGKASKITKEELITQLNPDIDLSNSNITVTELAKTAMDNFLTIDGDIVKKANKLLQEVIEEIDLSASNVVVSQETTHDNVHKVLVTNTTNTTLKADKLPQEIINNINLSASNISVEHAHTAGATLKPLMVDENGNIKSEDTITPDIISGDIFAKGFKTIIMTKELYPNGIDDLKETGLYSLASMDEYKDIINDNLPPERKEYITKVLNQILITTKSLKKEDNALDIKQFSDLMYSPSYQIQVVGVSQGATDNTIIQQIFSLFGLVLGTRKGTMKLDTITFEDVVRKNAFSFIPKINQKELNGVFTLNDKNEIVFNEKVSTNAYMLNITTIDDTNSIADYNEIVEEGFYGISKDLANKPPSETTGLLQVIVVKTDEGKYILQTQFINNSAVFAYPNFYTRTGQMVGDALHFTDWTKVNIKHKEIDFTGFIADKSKSVITQLTKETDLNNITTIGKYMFFGNEDYLNTITNKPTELDGSSFILEVDSIPFYEGDKLKTQATQIAYNLDGFDFNGMNKIKYHRMQTNIEQNTWGNWNKRDIDLSTIGSVSETTATMNKVLVKDNDTIKDITLSDFINNHELFTNELKNSAVNSLVVVNTAGKTFKINKSDFIADYAVESIRKRTISVTPDFPEKDLDNWREDAVYRFEKGCTKDMFINLPPSIINDSGDIGENYVIDVTKHSIKEGTSCVQRLGVLAYVADQVDFRIRALPIEMRLLGEKTKAVVDWEVTHFSKNSLVSTASATLNDIDGFLGFKDNDTAYLPKEKFIPDLSKYSLDVKYTTINNGDNITDVKDLPEGYFYLRKTLTNEPPGLRNENVGLIPFIHNRNGRYFAYVSNGEYPFLNPSFIGETDALSSSITWKSASILDITQGTLATKTGTYANSDNVLMSNRAGTGVVAVPKTEFKATLDIANTINVSNMIDYTELKKSLGITGKPSITSLYDKLPNNTRVSVYIPDGQITGASGNDIYNINKIDNTKGYYLNQTFTSDNKIVEHINIREGNNFNTWIHIFDKDGSNPKNRPITYTNSYGTWTETKLSNGKILLEGWGEGAIETYNCSINNTEGTKSCNVNYVFTSGSQKFSTCIVIGGTKDTTLGGNSFIVGHVDVLYINNNNVRINTWHGYWKGSNTDTPGISIVPENKRFFYHVSGILL